MCTMGALSVSKCHWLIDLFRVDVKCIEALSDVYMYIFWKNSNLKLISWNFVTLRAMSAVYVTYCVWIHKFMSCLLKSSAYSFCEILTHHISRRDANNSVGNSLRIKSLNNFPHIQSISHYSVYFCERRNVA